MPTFDWIGKRRWSSITGTCPRGSWNATAELSVGDPDGGEPAGRGGQPEALKALCPAIGGRSKCIYIDPPYNTGNESWVYNDNVNDPRIRKWLGNVVGTEAEDLCRHDKWLCMMYPRLRCCGSSRGRRSHLRQHRRKRSRRLAARAR